MELTSGRELEGMRAILASPSYGPSDQQCQRELRVGMMVAAKRGLSWEGDASPDRDGFATARNKVAQSMLEGGAALADGIMWVDNDIRQHPSSIASLLVSVRKFDAEFVSGVYHQRAGLHNPVFYHFNKKRQKFQPYHEYPDGMFAPVEGCGFGFVWTSLKLVSAIAAHERFDPKEGWFPDHRDSEGFGEDLSFCFQAMNAGIQLYVNTCVQVGHTADPVVITKEDFIRERAKFEADPEHALKRAPLTWGHREEIR